MRPSRLFAAGLTAALLIGGASPAFAKPAKDPKPPKAAPGRVTGGGVTAGRASFSVEARDGRPAKGHFNYTSRNGKLKVRCSALQYSPVVYIQPGPPGAHVSGDCVELGRGHQRTPISLDATFFDHGAKGDQAHISLTRPDGTTVNDSGELRAGNIHVRN